MLSVGFEPTPPKRTELESVALDRSAKRALLLCIHTHVYIIYIQHMTVWPSG